MRAVVDTNVLISGVLWSGSPHVLLEHLRNGDLVLVSSPTLLAEVVGRAKFDAVFLRSNFSREATLSEVRQLAEVIEPPPLPVPVCRDPDDDHVLALAIAVRVNLIVSGDDDLLGLMSFENIPIVSVLKAVAKIGQIKKSG